MAEETLLMRAGILQRKRAEIDNLEDIVAEVEPYPDEILAIEDIKRRWRRIRLHRLNRIP